LKADLNLYRYAASSPLVYDDPLGLAIKQCFRPFRSRRLLTLTVIGYLVGWTYIQPPLPGVRGCLAHEYVYNTTTGDSYGYDPHNIARETGRDLCYTIPEPIGQCVWDNIQQLAGSMANYNFLTRNCQTSVNDAIEFCKRRQCTLQGPPFRQTFEPPLNHGSIQ